MEEQHKLSVDARVKYIGVFRQEHPRPGTITALINQYRDTVVDGHTYRVVHPFAEPMYQVKWDDKPERLPIMAESVLVLSVEQARSESPNPSQLSIKRETVLGKPSL